MAATSQTVVYAVEVQPPSCNLGGHEIRYLSLVDKTKISLPISLLQCKGVPLFLASDVLNGTTVAKKNQPRIHARYAKDGFAIKLVLNGLKLDGINNSHEVWFYSIQGLFHVVFDLHSPEVQRDCLLHLKDVWLDHFHDLPLEERGVAALDFADLSSSYDSGTKNCVFDGTLNFETSPEISLTASHASNSSVANYHNTCKFKENNLAKDLVPKMSDSHSVIAGEFIEKLVNFVQTQISDVDNLSHHIVCHVLTTFDYLKCISNFATDDRLLPDYGLVFFQMMEDFLTLLKKDIAGAASDNQDTFGMEKHKFFLLQIISEWLGKEFHSLESQIATRVDLFKKENINAIDNLPPSQVIIDTLFPSFMKQLIINWLGISEKSGLDTDLSCFEYDHDYSPEVKKPRPSVTSSVIVESQPPFYPLVQLILEFASNSLVSGVAHVVYSRLRYAT
ncbi:hypothetical protein CHS0354_019826 [Potamilus streckersoni]|uniref:Uncharacterized protein n=1 Tax=Potamilus streckersoni TaxID=2493646 RepID=A0AAE0TEN5_9BIVA|nr:hypothetical protein CHS0354_019826 [Potamilus streckersoni]